MRLPARLLGAAFLMSSMMAASAYAGDAFKFDGFPYSDDVTIDGIKGGQMAARVKGAEKLYDLSKVEWIKLENQKDFNKAEDNRKDAKTAAALYKTAINSVNDRKLRPLVLIRSVGPLDADGKYADAVQNFLDVYQAFPLEAIWTQRPVNMPEAPSKFLTDAATKIETRVKSFTSIEAKKNLELWQLELLQKAGDPKAAALAKKLGTGVADSTGSTPANPNATSTPPTVDPVIAAGKGLEGVSAAITAKQFDKAIELADKELVNASGSTAIELFKLKARAYEGKGDEAGLALAAASLLRIPAHYPGSGEAPVALLRAADIQMKLKHDVEAKRIYQEIVDQYPNSAAAVQARPHLQ